MSLPAAFVTFGPQGPGLSAGASLPLGALLLGQPLEKAAALLPRLFNLCRVAQEQAARLSLGLPDASDPTSEVIRDHVLKLCLLLPRSFNLPPQPLPANPAALLGPAGLPDSTSGLQDWHSPAAPLVQYVTATFPPGIATSPALPPPPSPLAEGAYENSAAGRQAGHPLLREVEASHGRGPLWRLCGLLADLQAALADRLPAATVTDRIASVPAARGTYALRLDHAGGLVTGIARRTPTDHMLFPGGALIHALANLPPALHSLAPQVIALHDPCIPVTVKEASHA